MTCPVVITRRISVIRRVVFPAKFRQDANDMNDDELDRLIRETHSAPEFPSSFQREVWAKVSVAGQTSRRVGFSGWMESFFQLLAQPATATAAVVTMMILGVGLGRLAAPETDTNELKTAYLVSIDPTRAAHPANLE